VSTSRQRSGAIAQVGEAKIVLLAEGVTKNDPFSRRTALGRIKYPEKGTFFAVKKVRLQHNDILLRPLGVCQPPKLRKR
jgi:hypothetical protein